MPIYSFVDKLSKRLAPIMRKLVDMQIVLTGSEVNALILGVDEINSLEDVDTSILSSRTIPVQIKFPGEITIFRNRDIDGNYIDDGAIFIEDILPIEMYVAFTNEDIAAKNITVEETDVVVYVLNDDHNNKIPQIMQVTRSRGSFLVKEMIYKKYIISPFRANIQVDVFDAVQNYVLSLD
jgi:hypothetical protein